MLSLLLNPVPGVALTVSAEGGESLVCRHNEQLRDEEVRGGRAGAGAAGR